ncbi:thiamine ABC transporter substrate binding subunit [Utexia brackfieldae]|uniref:thiamine ABC transporter substrate binding subunit n=1 Tax=Utexia brackfieldae TaxID=3074108 RepID=UPI00370D0962
MFRIFMTAFFSVCLTFPLWANSRPILNIYTYSSFISEWGPGAAIKQLFEAQCDCQIKYTAFGDGVTILNRLKLEVARSKADVIIGLDNNLITATRQADLVQPHHIAPFAHQQLDWWDPLFIPYDYGYFAFVYNRDKIANPPQSMQALLTSPEAWKIVYQDPRTSTPGLGLLLWIQALYGEQSHQAWQQLATKTLTITKGWSEAYSLMLKGEADFVLSYDTSPAVHLMNDHDDRFVSAKFSEGHYQQIEVAAITKTTQQLTLAQQFLAFLGQPEVQRVIATKNIMHPVIDIELPAAFKQLITVDKTLRLPPEAIEAHRKQWIALWQSSVSD